MSYNNQNLLLNQQTKPNRVNVIEQQSKQAIQAQHFLPNHLYGSHPIHKSSSSSSSFHQYENNNNNAYEEIDNMTLPPPPPELLNYSCSDGATSHNQHQQSFLAKQQFFSGFSQQSSKDKNNNKYQQQQQQQKVNQKIRSRFPLPPESLLNEFEEQSQSTTPNIANNNKQCYQTFNNNNDLYANLGTKLTELKIVNDDQHQKQSIKTNIAKQPTTTTISNVTTNQQQKKPTESSNIYDQIFESDIAIPRNYFNNSILNQPNTRHSTNSINKQYSNYNNQIYENFPIPPSNTTTSTLNTAPVNHNYQNKLNNNNYINNNQYSNTLLTTKPLSNNKTNIKKQEEQVDKLTDLLVKSMENSAEPDFFGMCNKCGEKVVGEGNGCTAMEMVYHIQCFTCHVCNKELRGKPFYAMENNPHCEECYLNTLEKCSVCEKPILDRILRATGKPYHPSCFICIVCNKCLDGIPFTVDANNQVHCIDCFHGKFAPRCSVCNAPIVPEPGKTETVRVVALDRSFHVSCYKCEDCDLLLSSEVEGRGCYPLDDHILCRGCNAKRVQAITAN